jgi:alpha-ketoglutarate-dependent taurine dioxygenase
MSESPPLPGQSEQVQSYLLDRRGAGLPLVIEPLAGGDLSPTTAATWLRTYRVQAEALLQHHGALLLRGFAVRTAADFEQVVRGIGAELKRDYFGTSPRNAVTDYVFNASELPDYYPIPQHCEMSFLPKPPRRLFFSCLLAPSGPGGETPLCDFRQVYRQLDPQVRQRFIDRGIQNRRSYGGPEGSGRFDLWQLKPWHQLFGTTSRAAVEAQCQALGLDCTWQSNGRLQLTNVQPAMRAHPQTGELAWFNHLQVFHLSTAAAEYQRIAQRIPALRYQLLRAVAIVGSQLKRLRGSQALAMHCTFGDGGEIPRSAVEHVRDVIWQNLVCFRWQLGDVLLIDNFAVSHGRLPYRGRRHIVVCWE